MKTLEDLPVAFASVNVFFNHALWGIREIHEDLLFAVPKEQLHDSFPVYMYRCNGNHWLEVRDANNKRSYYILCK